MAQQTHLNNQLDSLLETMDFFKPDIMTRLEQENDDYSPSPTCAYCISCLFCFLPLQMQIIGKRRS